MAQKSWHLNRRSILKGIGVSCMLPYLECMAADAKKNSKGPAKRAAFIYTPNGVSLPPKKNPAYNDWHWFPHQTGDNFKFTKTLESLEPFRQKLTVIGGLSHPKSRTLLGHAAGDTWLTGGDIGGSVYKNSVSIDQVAAREICKDTRHPFLNFSCDGGVGYKSRVSTLSFNANGKAIPTESNPRAIFERFFSSGDKASLVEQRKRLKEGRKVVDIVMGDAYRLNKQLGKNDQLKLDEYLTSLSEVEERIKRTEEWLNVPMKKVTTEHINFSVKQSAPQDYIRTMMDLIVMAFETDITRTVTYMVAREDGMGHGDKFPTIALKLKGHHGISHDKSTGSYERWGRYDQFLAQQYTYLLERLNKVTDEHGSILDSTMTMYGSCCSNTHNARNYPLILAGGKNMGLKHGRYLKYDDKTPLSNLYVSMLNGLGVKTDTFADSTGKIDDIFEA